MDVEEEEDDGVGNQVKIPTLPAPDSLSSSSLCFITLFSYNLHDSDVVWLQIVTFRRHVNPIKSTWLEFAKFLRRYFFSPGTLIARVVTRLRACGSSASEDSVPSNSLGD